MASITEKIRDTFNHHNIQLDTRARTIQVYWIRDPRGVEWVPYGGGPLYREQAKDSARWLAAHLEEFRSLLPKWCATGRL